jgi:phage repressor protein C with HTH and peptisase S24 domain
MLRRLVNVEAVWPPMQDAAMARHLGDSAPVALRKFREHAGISMEKMAKDAGYSQASGVQRYENPEAFTEHYFPIKLVKKLEKALVGRGSPPIDRDDLYLALAGVLPPDDARSPRKLKPDVDLKSATTHDYERSEITNPTLPLFGSARGGFDGSEVDYINPVTYVPRPPELKNVKNAAAILVIGDSMEPRYFAGEQVIVDPRVPFRARDFVVVELHDSVAIIKQFLGRGPDGIRLRQYNGEPREWTIPIKDVVGIYKIVGTREKGF